MLAAAEFAAQPEAEDEDGEEEDAEGGAEGLVAGPGELVLDDFTNGGIGPAAHQVGDGEHGDGGNEDEEDAGGDAGLGQGENDLAEDAGRARPEVVGGFDEGAVEFFHAGVNGQNHEREKVVNQPENDREGRVHEGDGGAGDIEGHKEGVEQAFLRKNGNPGVGADEEAGPKRDHDQHDEEPAHALAGASDEIGHGVAEHQTDDGGEEGIPDGDPEDFQPLPVEGAGVVLEGEGVDDASEGVAFAEADHDEHEGRDNDKERQPPEHRGDGEPWPESGPSLERRAGGQNCGGGRDGHGTLLDFDRGDQFVDFRGLLADVGEELGRSHVEARRIAGRVVELLGTEQGASLEVRVVVREFVGNHFADIRAKDEVDEGLGFVLVPRGLGNGQVVDEHVDAFDRHDPLEFGVFREEQGAFAAPDDADVGITVAHGGLRAVGVEDFDFAQPVLEERGDGGEIFVAHVVDRDAGGGQAPRDNFAGVVEDDDAAGVFVGEDVLVADNGPGNDLGIVNNADKAGHPGDGELVVRVKRHVAELGGEVFQVGDFLLVEFLQEVLLDHGLHGVFARLNQVIGPASGEEFGQHFLVGGIILHRDLDAGFLREFVDHGLRHVFAPGEEFEGFVFFPATGEEQGSGAGRGEQFGFVFCHRVFLRVNIWLAMTRRAVAAMKSVLRALSCGLSPTRTIPYTLSGRVWESAPLVKMVTMYSSNERVKDMRAPATMAGMR